MGIFLPGALALSELTYCYLDASTRELRQVDRLTTVLRALLRLAFRPKPSHHHIASR
jgi:hypothetical protein